MSAKKQQKDEEAADEPELDNAAEDRQLDAAPQSDAQQKPDVAPKAEAQRKPDAPPKAEAKPQPQPQAKPKPKVEAEPKSTGKPAEAKSMAEIMKFDLKIRRPRR
ncbi:MAG: hypothetical protein WCA49_07980 [Candidatus Sulfotelmatobacter sp.]